MFWCHCCFCLFVMGIAGISCTPRSLAQRLWSWEVDIFEAFLKNLFDQNLLQILPAFQIWAGASNSKESVNWKTWTWTWRLQQKPICISWKKKLASSAEWGDTVKLVLIVVQSKWIICSWEILLSKKWNIRLNWLHNGVSLKLQMICVPTPRRV